MKKHVIVLGGDIIGLYAAIKCIEAGYEVSIIDKKHVLGNENYINYQFFNKSHSIYIQLLNKFNIKYTSRTINRNEKIFNILSYIIQKSKLIPKKNLYSQTFFKFCKTLIMPHEYEVLKAALSDFEHIYTNMSAMDFISMYMYDIIAYQEYYELQDNISILTCKIIKFLNDNGANFILNTEIKDIKHINNKVYLNSIKNSYIGNFLIITFSKNNLNKYKIFKEHTYLLNNVSSFNIKANNMYNVIDKPTTTKETNIQTVLLDKLHIVYPIKKYNNIYLWNIGTNNIIIREKIRNISPLVFICSKSFSKNVFFINYSLETVDNIFPKIIKTS